jgi:hypothetical protein
VHSGCTRCTQTVKCQAKWCTVRCTFGTRLTCTHGEGPRPLTTRRRLTCGYPAVRPLLVELPGIEPGSKIRLTCGNDGIEHAKRRQTTRDDLRIRPRC